MSPDQLLDHQQDLHDFACLVIFCVGVFAAALVAIAHLHKHDQAKRPPGR